MMSQSVNNADVETTDTDNNFGTELAEARKAQNYTVEEISGYLKIPVHTINLLEANDLEALPAATFTQGYIRAYAKFLEISEEAVLEKYNQAVPRTDTGDLKPRSNLPGEASSQSPLVKSITILLIVAGIAAVILGSFKYYQEKAGVMEGEMDAKEQSFTGNSLDSPGTSPLSIKQSELLTEDGELIVGQSESHEDLTEATVALGEAETAGDVEAGAAVDQVEEVSKEEVSENDIVEIFAEDGSWVQVRDANESRLFYNMVPVGGSKVLVGKAPFSITMGNAKTTRVVINKIEVDLTNYIRSNNTATFSISTDGQDIVFH